MHGAVIEAVIPFGVIGKAAAGAVLGKDEHIAVRPGCLNLVVVIAD